MKKILYKCNNTGEIKEEPYGYKEGQFSVVKKYDVAYPPDCSGGFSIICDCMFICKWHGCDSEGTLFSKDFGKLNENGLFDCAEDAYIYMVRYLGEDWSERGEFGIFEVYIKQL